MIAFAALLLVLLAAGVGLLALGLDLIDAHRHERFQSRYIREHVRGAGGSEYELARADDHRGVVRHG